VVTQALLLQKGQHSPSPPSATTVGDSPSVARPPPFSLPYRGHFSFLTTSRPFFFFPLCAAVRLFLRPAIPILTPFLAKELEDLLSLDYFFPTPGQGLFFVFFSDPPFLPAFDITPPFAPFFLLRTSFALFPPLYCLLPSARGFSASPPWKIPFLMK